MPTVTLMAAPAAINTAQIALKDIVDSSGKMDVGKLLDWVNSCQDALKVLSQDDKIAAQTALNAIAANQAAPAGQPARPPPQPKISYSHKIGEKWEDFRKAYENLALALGYTDHHARRYLLGCMRDEAFQMVSHLDHEAGTLEDLMEQYDEVFLPPAASQLAKEEFGAAHQNNKESLQTYHGRLKSLYNRAYPKFAVRPVPIDPHTGLPDIIKAAYREQSETRLIEKFVKTIHQKRVRAHILKMKPATYQDALTVALDESAVIVGENLTSLPGSSHVEPMEIGAIDAKTATCHYCKAVGHFAANCYKKAAALKKSSTPYKGGASKSVTFKKPFPGKAGSAKPPAKHYGKKPWESKSTFKRFIKELAEAITDDEEEEVLVPPEEKDGEDAAPEAEAEAGFFYSDDEDQPPEEAAEAFEDAKDETHF